ncbi:MAG: AAA family ATPase [Bifidobacteriaceae bacterium]|jgi:DNA polymerase-3 subunit delta'|nr:AAA family ATPase [Bifidobacteriaceae bacterium]
MSAKVFDALVGQSDAIDVLQNVLDNREHLVQSWLFTGPQGSGRSVLARAFAAAIECENGGCRNCSTCKTVMNDQNPDVTVILPKESVIKVQETREIIKLADKFPNALKKRIIIIEDADRMNDASFNSLLKSIEEPPENTIWILLAPTLESIIATIRSRCQKVQLKLPNIRDIAQYLIKETGVDATLAEKAARLSRGHIGIAKRYVTNSDELAEREQVTRDVLALSDAVSGYLLAQTVVEKSKQYTSSAEQSTKRQATDFIDDYLQSVMTVYTDIAKLQARNAESIVNAQNLKELQHLAKNTSVDSNLRCINAIQTARRRLFVNVKLEVLLEALFSNLN